MSEATVSPTTTALVALLKLKGIGRRGALRMINEPLDQDDPQEDLVRRTGRAKLAEAEVREAWRLAQADEKKTSDAGVRAFSFHDEGYPQRLRNIPDPPAVLYVKGEVSGLQSSRCLAIVGTREPTVYGEKVARRSAATAVDEGYVIVSGLAHGCDTLGHEGCLDRQGVGVAVMAHGLDKVYPAANRDLAGRLLDAGGCMVSEYPVGATPMRTAFAERDRIQSGLSDIVLVIETDVKGGTMHTVRFSRDQKRILACIAHPEAWLHEEKTKGNQMLIADRWANPIADSDALIRLLRGFQGDETKAADEPLTSADLKSQISMGF